MRASLLQEDFPTSRQLSCMRKFYCRFSCEKHSPVKLTFSCSESSYGGNTLLRGDLACKRHSLAGLRIYMGEMTRPKL